MEAAILYYGGFSLSEIRAMDDCTFMETFRAIEYIREQEAKQQNGRV